jgi:hypothetical protein
MRIHTAFVVLFLLSAPIAHASNNEFSQLSLKGLKGVAVIIEDLKPEIEQNGLTVTAIQTDVELKLRQAGIPISATGAGNPSLHISVNILQSTSAILPHVITIELRQTVFLTRDPSIIVPGAATWDVGVFGQVPKLNVRSLRDDVKDLVDRFINAYLAVNPQK